MADFSFPRLKKKGLPLIVVYKPRAKGLSTHILFKMIRKSNCAKLGKEFRNLSEKTCYDEETYLLKMYFYGHLNRFGKDAAGAAIAALQS